MEFEIGFGDLLVTTYDVLKGDTTRRFGNIRYESVVFAQGILQFEDAEENVIQFCYHGPFTYRIEYR